MDKKQLPRGLRNNNPCNIRKSADVFVGEIVPSKDEAFKQFSTMAYGYRATFVILYNYQHRYGLDTIAKMIARFAPSSENHTEAYINAVAERSGVSANGRITATNGDVMMPIVAAMNFVENGVEANISDVEKGWKLFIEDFRNHKV